MFQITRDKEEHGVKEVGLEKIDGLKFPSNAHRYCVAVTSHGIEPQIKVPAGRFKNVDVFHHPVTEDRLLSPV